MDIQASVAFLYSTSVQKHLLISFSLSSALTPYLTEQLYVFSAYAREPLLGACFRHLTHPLYGDLINRLPGTPPTPLLFSHLPVSSFCFISSQFCLGCLLTILTAGGQDRLGHMFVHCQHSEVHVRSHNSHHSQYLQCTTPVLGEIDFP